MKPSPVHGCRRDCRCECHQDVEAPAPHIAACAFADLDYEPDAAVEALRDAGLEPGPVEATR